MSGLIYLFGSGQAFFVGVGLVLTADVLFSRPRRGWVASLVTILALVGIAVIVLSATPLSYWYYGLALAITLVWLVAERRRDKEPRAPSASSSSEGDPQPAWRGAVRLRAATAAIWVCGIALELPHLFSPH